MSGREELGDAGYGPGPRRPLRVKGHALRGFECNVYGDRRYVCECGDRGFPDASLDYVRENHRAHKQAVLAGTFTEPWTG